MQYTFDHIDRLAPSRDPGECAVDLSNLTRAELDTVKMLFIQAADSERSHVDLSIIIRDEDGRPVSVVCVHAAVKRLQRKPMSNLDRRPYALVVGDDLPILMAFQRLSALIGDALDGFADRQQLANGGPAPLLS